MIKDDFLSRASNSSDLLSESKILSQLSQLGKSIIISFDDYTVFQKNFATIKDKIRYLKLSRIHHIILKEDRTMTTNDIGQNSISEASFMNISMEYFTTSKFCFVVNSGIEIFVIDGKISEEVNICLQKTKTMKEQLDCYKPIASIREVFENFHTFCKFNKQIYIDHFDEASNKVKAEILEQQLRNLLLKYLDKQMKGDVLVEFCTDYINDEESVDIYLNDGSERAIIEVKFSLPQSHYLGKTFYNIYTRIKDGLKQLNKYASHLSKDSRLVDYGYVYMFYIPQVDDQLVTGKIVEVIDEYRKELTPEFHSIYSGHVMNNMLFWGRSCDSV